MLQFIYGKAGSGKTTACFQRAKEVSGSVFFIVPEGFSLAQERKVVSEFGAGFSVGGGSVPSVDVLSFNRFAAQFFARFGPLTPEYASPVTAQMLMQKTLLELEGKLHILGSLEPDTALSLMNEFDRYQISPDVLEGLTPENKLFALKLQDIVSIQKTYHTALEKRRLPTVSPLSALASRLDELGENPFESTYFVLDQFTSFTTEEYAVIERILRLSKGVFVTLLTDSLNKPDDSLDSHTKPDDSLGSLAKSDDSVSPLAKPDDSVSPLAKPNVPLDSLAKSSGFDVFSESKQTASRLIELCIQNNVKIAPNLYLKGERENNVTIFHADNPYGEVTEVARKIVQLVKNGTPQHEIALIAHDCDMYAGLIRQVFPRFGIDVFIDNAECALKSPDVYAFLTFVNIFTQNYSTSSILKYLKTTDIPQKLLNMLENYCLAFGMSKRQWLGEREIDDEVIREIVDDATVDIRAINSAISGRKTVAQIIAALPQSENSESSIVQQVLDEMLAVFSDEYITFEKFYAILKAGFAAIELTQIPQTKNQAIFCAIERYKGHKPQCLFILGAQDGAFPARHVVEGVLSDNERVFLEKQGIALAETCENRQIREQQTVYFCTHSPRERLFLFHCASDLKGRELSPSPVLSQFPNADYEDNIYGRPLPVPEPRPKPPATLESPLISELYNQSSATSISRIEAFSRCQFAYFMRYGLRAVPRKENKITPPDSGNLMHKVIERFCKIGDFNDINAIEPITKQVLTEMCSENLRENPRFASVQNRIISELKTVAENISEFYNSTDFKPFAFEEALPELTLALDDGKEVTLRGRVDRVDICRTAQGNYVNIVDYKSSETTIEPEDIACGVQVQLPVYIKAICERYSKNSDGAAFFPAGMLYYKFDDPLCESEDTPSNAQAGAQVGAQVDAQADAQVGAQVGAQVDAHSSTSANIRANVQAEIRKKLRMRGLMLDVAPNLGGYAFSNPVGLERMDEVCETALRAVKNQLEKITKGALAINPHDSKACEFCDYSAVCREVARHGMD